MKESLSYIAEDIRNAQRIVAAASEHPRSISPANLQLAHRQLERAMESLARFADSNLPVVERAQPVVIDAKAYAKAA